jgi:hypothetical protein
MMIRQNKDQNFHVGSSRHSAESLKLIDVLGEIFGKAICPSIDDRSKFPFHGLKLD